MLDVFKIINFIKKQFGLKDLLIITAILTLFFFTRLTNLTDLPIFGDEGIYIRWAKTAWQDANWRFISLTDGRQPLQTWLTIPFLKLFPENPLLAGRLFGVLSGSLSLIGIFFCLFYLFDKKTAYLGSTLYTATPYFLFYDRMALADSMVNAGFIWLFFLSLLIWKTQRIDSSLIFGLAAGFFMLAKSSLRLALISAFTAPVLGINHLFSKTKNKFIKKTINYYILISSAAVVALIIYNIQRLSPFFHFVSQKNLTFVMSFEEFLQNPFSRFPTNIRLIPYFIFSETTVAFAFFVILGFIKLFQKDKGLFFYLLIWLFIPITAIAFFAKVLFPRYLLFTAGLLLIPSAFYLSEKSLFKRFAYIKFAVLFIFIFQVLRFDYAILFDQKNIPFPQIDKGQYLTGSTAGWGLTDILDFAREKAKEKPVIILAEGNFGVVGDQLEALKKPNDKNISIKGYWPFNKESILENQDKLKDNYVFIVLVYTKEIPEDWPARLLKQYKKPNSNERTTLLQLIDNSN